MMNSVKTVGRYELLDPIGYGMLAALDHAEGYGIVHRDLPCVRAAVHS
jgi:hypothetical protein